MAGSVTNDLRNVIISGYREAVAQKLEITPFAHQREWWCASDGLHLLHGVQDDNGVTVAVPIDPENPKSGVTIEKWATVARPGGVARFCSDLGSFKIGKSFGAALWLTGFAAVPNARVSLVGLEYDICEPEFSYLCDFLLSERGMGMKYDSLQNRPRDGRMYLDLTNGARFEAKSWERKDTLKGKEIDAYCFCEAFMLPGIECFTANSQNLRARHGFAVFPTTPDRPWVKELHNLGHGFDPEWHCTCSVPATVNPYTYDPKAKARDVRLMTKEKFQIHYLGQLGDFVGQVFNYQQGQAQFTPITHPDLFDKDGNLRLPPGYEVVCGADTGTFYTALAVAFSPAGEAFVLGEYPNYAYVGGEAERDEKVTIPSWSDKVNSGVVKLGGRTSYWADPNSQFKRELLNYGMTLLPAKVPVETRTEIAREYFEHGKIWFHPDLKILPFEIEHAEWPEDVTAAGKYARVKDRDHTLDCLEHILARRPRGKWAQALKRPKSWAESHFGRKKSAGGINVHLGRQ